MILRQASPCADGSGAARRSRAPRPRPPEIAEAHFLERAKYYRFAAAMTENPEKIARLCEVALMFERMAYDVRRLRDRQSRFPAACGEKSELPPVAAGAAGFTKIWHVLAEFIRLSRP